MGDVTYSEILDVAGEVRVDQVRRSDGANVLTGLMPLGDAAEAIPGFDDPDGLAYQAWLAAGNKPGVPVVSLADLVTYANQKQWDLATGGYTITLSGQARTFATSVASMTLMNGKFLRLTQANPPATISWQFATGFEDVSFADFVKAAVTISDFVQATFDALKPILAAIAAGTITTTAQIDAAAWPSATTA